VPERKEVMRCKLQWRKGIVAENEVQFIPLGALVAAL
jgi:hypothetical protein